MPDLPSTDIDFDDFFGLMRRPLAELDLLVLCGASGSGKSTTLEALLERHAAFRGSRMDFVTGSPIDWRSARVSAPLVVVDEIVALRDLWHIRRHVASGRRVLAASHLPPAIHSIAAAGCRCLVVRCAPDAAAIARHVRRLGHACTCDAARAFCAAGGASFTDAAIVLEHAGGGADFDTAWRAFARNCTIRHTLSAKRT